MSLERLVEGMDASYDRICTASPSLKCLCNKDLLRATVGRARGVVARRLGDTDAAKLFFADATDAASHALPSVRSRQVGDNSPGDLPSAYDRSPFEVLADVHYSHAYFWYELGNTTRAAELFLESIKALAASGAPESWDSPYTRLAIVYLITGDFAKSASSAIRGRNICKTTPVELNREAPLSMAVNTLTLRVIEGKTSWKMLAPEADPIRELTAALELNPPLGLGPLTCHRKDASLVMAQSGGTDRTISEEFVERLRQAEKDVYSSQRRRG